MNAFHLILFIKKYTLGGVEVEEQVLQCFKLQSKNNDGGVIRFVDSEWHFMNARQNEIKIDIFNIRTQKSVDINVDLYVSIAFGQLT